MFVMPVAKMPCSGQLGFPGDGGCYGGVDGPEAPEEETEGFG
jgi:hypothetical protein